MGMTEKTRTHRPQEAIDIAGKIDASIHYMGGWMRALQLVDELDELVELIDNVDVVVAFLNFRHAVRRNPPKNAFDIMIRLPELYHTMDELDRTQSVTKPIKKNRRK